MKVKTTFLLTLTLLIISSVSILPGFAQYVAYTQLSLPEGAIARLGKGSVGEVTYSPGGSLLAVGSNTISNILCFIYGRYFRNKVLPV